MARTGYDPDQARAVKKRTGTAALLIFLFIPAVILTGTFLGGGHYMLISLVVVVCTMVPFFLVFERRKPKAREIVLVATMTAITVVSHLFFHVTVPLQIGTAMVIVAGISMGPEAGFLVGALARFVCNFYMGQGPWTPWQMFSWGLLGFLAGLTFNKVDLYEKTDQAKSSGFKVVMGPVLSVVFAELVAYISFLVAPGEDTAFGGWRIYAFGFIGILVGVLLLRKRMPVDSITITVFTFFTTVILYGGIMNVSAMFTMPTGGGAGTEISWNALRLLYVSGLPYDLAHGGAAALCIFVMGKPMIRKIERIKIKYGIYK